MSRLLPHAGYLSTPPNKINLKKKKRLGPTSGVTPCLGFLNVPVAEATAVGGFRDDGIKPFKGRNY